MWIPEDIDQRSGFEQVMQPQKSIAITDPKTGRVVGERALTPDEQQAEDRRTAAVDLMLRGSGIASKYFAPAGAVTLAGFGLSEITRQFNAQADANQQTQSAIMP